MRILFLGLGALGFAGGVASGQTNTDTNKAPTCGSMCHWTTYGCVCNGTRVTGLTSEAGERSVGAVTLPSGERISL